MDSVEATVAKCNFLNKNKQSVPITHRVSLAIQNDARLAMTKAKADAENVLFSSELPPARLQQRRFYLHAATASNKVGGKACVAFSWVREGPPHPKRGRGMAQARLGGSAWGTASWCHSDIERVQLVAKKSYPWHVRGSVGLHLIGAALA